MIIKNMREGLFVFGVIGVTGLGVLACLSRPSAPIQQTAQTAMIASAKSSSDWVADETKVISSKAGNLSEGAVRAGLTAYQKARKEGLDNKEILTIIDYSKPSADQRLLVWDMKNQKVLFNTWVAHGKNSGEKNATSFSNDPRSLKSSLGVFVTSGIYDGKHGESLRIQGLEPGINNNAYRRDIVFHGAQYVGADVARTRGMLGRSWGCMAVDQKTIKPLINAIKGNTLVVAYYPDKNWESHSAFL